MQPTKYPKIKICCIQNIYEAQLAIQHSASAIGLVSAMPSGPGVISEKQIQKITAVIPPSVSSFLLTSKIETAAIIEQQRQCGVNTIQLCDRLQLSNYPVLKLAMPGIAIVQVIHVVGEESIQEAVSVAPHVHSILLDSGNQSLPIKKLGGTGRTHDWSISRKIRELVDVPIFLAGGLNPQNVNEAITQVAPYAIDVCSGIRTNGNLDEVKLTKFVEQIPKSN